MSYGEKISSATSLHYQIDLKLHQLLEETDGSTCSGPVSRCTIASPGLSRPVPILLTVLDSTACIGLYIAALMPRHPSLVSLI